MSEDNEILCTINEAESLGFKMVERSYTRAALLDIFDDQTIVYHLVMRIDALAARLAKVEAFVAAYDKARSESRMGAHEQFDLDEARDALRAENDAMKEGK